MHTCTHFTWNGLFAPRSEPMLVPMLLLCDLLTNSRGQGFEYAESSHLIHFLVALSVFLSIDVKMLAFYVILAYFSLMAHVWTWIWRLD